jgi:hypothetical protein
MFGRVWRPHRCEHRLWRGWTVHEHHHHGEHTNIRAEEALVPPQGEPDLGAIDNSLRRR